MIEKITLPELGENIETGVVVKILVAIGGVVEIDQGIIEIETDKAVVEVPSPFAGIVAGIHITEGDEIKVGEAIISIELEKIIKEEKEAGAIKEAGDVEETDSSLLASDSDVPSPGPKEIESHASGAKVEEEISPLKTTTPNREVAPAAPSVRRFAREVGIDLHEVIGSGPGGRISMEDVKSHLRTSSGNKSIASAPVRGEEVALPDFTTWGDIEKTRMSMVRKKTASHLSQVWQTVPQVTQFDQADMTGMERFRKTYGEKVRAAGGKLTVTAILMKIVASALKVFPAFNASVDMQHQEIIYKKYVHIGVAVDTERGLLVPVIRDVDRMDLIDIAVQLNDLAAKARSSKLGLAEMQGGNFTISNLGGIGGTAFTPIVNWPEVAILGVSRSFEQRCATCEQSSNGQQQNALMLPLSLSYDHRIIDGAEGARFLNWIKAAIEQPLLIVLGTS